MSDPTIQGAPRLTNDPAAAAIARAVCDPAWVASASRLKQTGHVTVRAGEVRLRGVFRGEMVVKSMSLDRRKDRLSRWFGSTRLVRQWRGALLLAHAGLPVATPIVLFRGRSARGGLIETMVMQRVGDGVPRDRCAVPWLASNGSLAESRDTLLHLLASDDLTLREERQIARVLGADLRAMFDAGLWNRDHKPSNMIAEKRDSGWGAWRIVYIDTAGVRETRSHRVSAKRIARTLASMILEPMGVGHPVRRATMMRVLRTLHQSTPDPRANVRRDWRAVAEIVRAHGDPTPKDDPLE